MRRALWSKACVGSRLLKSDHKRVDFKIIHNALQSPYAGNIKDDILFNEVCDLIDSNWEIRVQHTLREWNMSAD